MRGGTVSVRSAGLGQRSTFTIRLPRTARAETLPSEAASVKAPSRRVLIVNDNVDGAASLEILLVFQGHEVGAVHGGKDALDCVEAFRPEVALLDIGLPEMDGYELAKRLFRR
ncbi:MAG: response regulator [Steroidobacteraceae bacterium]